MRTIDFLVFFFFCCIPSTFRCSVKMHWINGIQGSVKLSWAMWRGILGSRLLKGRKRTYQTKVVRRSRWQENSSLILSMIISSMICICWERRWYPGQWSLALNGPHPCLSPLLLDLFESIKFHPYLHKHLISVVWGRATDERGWLPSNCIPLSQLCSPKYA